MPAKPSDPVTTDDLLVACGVTREDLYKWVAQKLLARPTLTDSPSGLVAVWPGTALDRVRFIVKKQREELPLNELVELVRARWPAQK